MPEIQDVVPVVIEDDPSTPSVPLLSEAAPSPVQMAVRLNVRGITVEVTNDATQSLIQNPVAAL